MLFKHELKFDIMIIKVPIVLAGVTDRVFVATPKPNATQPWF